MDHAQPLVSVVIAAYRHRDYVEACIDSIVRQTYPNIEVVLVDDSSPDDTHDVAAQTLSRHASRFTRHVLKRNSANRGAPFTFNRGMRLAQGTYLALLNSDDMFDETRVEAIVAALESNGAAWAFSSVMPIDADGQPTFRSSFAHRLHWMASLQRASLPTVSWGFLPSQQAISSGNVVLAKWLVDRVGLFAPLQYCHDWDYFLRCCLYSEPVFVDQPLYQYRLHESNSYLTLDNLAVVETNYCLRQYLTRVMTGKPANPSAPSPQNWPGLFEPLLEALGIRPHLDALYRPYRSHFRTVDPQSDTTYPQVVHT